METPWIADRVSDKYTFVYFGVVIYAGERWKSPKGHIYLGVHPSNELLARAAIITEKVIGDEP